MWEQRLINTSRGTFEIFVKGSGEPLCVTHLYSEFNANGNTVANPFTKHHTVYLVNLRAAGQSAPSLKEHDLSMAESVKDLEAIREALQYEKWAFAGHSTGGMLALIYAILAEQSLTKIIAGGAAASSEYMHHKDSIYCKENANNERIKEIMQLLNDPQMPLEERRKLGREWTEMSIYHKERYDVYFSRPNSGKVVNARLNYFSYIELKKYDLRPQLPKVTIPSYIYGGIHDTQCPYYFSQEMADLIPNAKLFTFEESNHYPFVEEEQKFEEFVKATL
ncbi:alpha/beta fold hydrolase [Viridibacillus sp. YIM B01967]|uniref:Alpha/beta fold hydrolase n=1 Tax=Viridibacillus soli TaxID=2798301 RepID=A0ABS1H4H0_9BACL|nr:alpha/beta fold hydrolase [Viridibacillus soli]MBK3494196.1 alpha/beta fold hydrolase [Viridibacillus soli]